MSEQSLFTARTVTDYLLPGPSRKLLKPGTAAGCLLEHCSQCVFGSWQNHHRSSRAPDTDDPGAVLLHDTTLLLSAPSRRDRPQRMGVVPQAHQLARHGGPTTTGSPSQTASMPVQQRGDLVATDCSCLDMPSALQVALEVALPAAPPGLLSSGCGAPPA